MRAGALAEAALWGLALVLLALGAGLDRSLAMKRYSPGVHEPGSLRIVTWNVGGDRDGRPHGLLPEHQEAVAATLLALDPDLVLLQEVGDRGALERLAQRLGPAWKVVRGRGDLGALSPRLELATWRTPLSRSLGLTLTLGERELALLALHADAFSAEDRNREVGPLVEALLERRADAYLLAGDLNLDLDLDKRADLFSSDLHLDVETYNFVATRLVDVGRRAGPTAEPDRRLDYVFVSAALEARSVGPWKGRRVGSMDHDPLVADLSWR